MGPKPSDCNCHDVGRQEDLVIYYVYRAADMSSGMRKEDSEPAMASHKASVTDSKAAFVKC